MYILIFSITTIIGSFLYFLYYNSTKDINTNSDINEFLLGESVDEDTHEIINLNNIQTMLDN
jgi:hypothetical protein